MGKTYLFTPIGNTDPIKYFYDGSMLHICRHYKPNIVYLYLSKEMIENQKYIHTICLELYLYRRRGIKIKVFKGD